jgi:hypothetical protein
MMAIGVLQRSIEDIDSCTDAISLSAVQERGESQRWVRVRANEGSISACGWAVGDDCRKLKASFDRTSIIIANFGAAAPIEPG